MATHNSDRHLLSISRNQKTILCGSGAPVYSSNFQSFFQFLSSLGNDNVGTVVISSNISRSNFSSVKVTLNGASPLGATIGLDHHACPLVSVEHSVCQHNSLFFLLRKWGLKIRLESPSSQGTMITESCLPLDISSLHTQFVWSTQARKRDT